MRSDCSDLCLECLVEVSALINQFLRSPAAHGHAYNGNLSLHLYILTFPQQELIAAQTKALRGDKCLAVQLARSCHTKPALSSSSLVNLSCHLSFATLKTDHSFSVHPTSLSWFLILAL